MGVIDGRQWGEGDERKDNSLLFSNCYLEVKSQLFVAYVELLFPALKVFDQLPSRLEM